MLMETLSGLLIKVICMVLFGVFLRKKNIITKELQAGLSSLLLNAILPISVVGSVEPQCTPRMVQALLWTALISTVYYFFAFGLSKLMTAKMSLSVQGKQIFIMMNMFANVGFIGMPLCSALCGKEGFLIAVVYNLVYQVFLVFVGIPMLRGQKGICWEMLKDPLLIVSLAALAVFVSPFRLPTVVQEVCDDIGSMMVPVSMLIIGSDLADQKLSVLFKDVHSYLVCTMRLIVYPLLMFVIIKQMDLPSMVLVPTILLTALPCGSLNVILAKQYDCEPEFASRAVILSMVLMVITLPGILWIMGQ
ncbi:MAG: AEC family transporter [Lachnospiraceae bacterium]|nr:AEC family transporter [Lachnospiraceae bacterium]